MAHVLNLNLFNASLVEAQAALTQYNAANKKLAAEMLAWLREQLPAGTVIDLSYQKARETQQPAYLINAKVVRGNSRHTKLFRIGRITRVEPNVGCPDLSAWYADVTAISMTTGKDMSGTPGNAKNARQFLELKGAFGFEDY